VTLPFASNFRGKMTSDEMNRAMEFILQQEAQLSVRMDELAKQMQELSELHKRDHGLLVQMAVQEQRMSELLQIQSRRLDRAEQEDRAAQKRHEETKKEFQERHEEMQREFQQRHEQLLQELRAGFDRLLAKLSEKPN
jgi:hypothetical protein